MTCTSNWITHIPYWSSVQVQNQSVQTDQPGWEGPLQAQHQGTLHIQCYCCCYCCFYWVLLSNQTPTTHSCSSSQASLKKFLDYIQTGAVEKLAKVLDKGLDPNFHDPDSGGGFFPLRTRANRFAGRTLTFPSLPTCGSETPLCVAVQSSLPVDGIKVLVQGGAHLDFRNKEGLTALHKAVRAHNHTGLLVRTPNQVAYVNIIGRTTNNVARL